LWDYIKEQNEEEAADRYTDDLFVTFETLAWFPDMDRPRAYLLTKLVAFPMPGR
jgi:plasmid stabilization system protein ParE